MKRKPRSAQFKSQVALEALKNQKTMNELAAEYEIHPNQISQWKKQLLEGLPSLFANGRAKATQNDEALQGRLYEEIGRLKVELDWLKKKLPHSVEEKRNLIDPDHSDISLRRQCDLVGLSRTGYYYQPVRESPQNLLMMGLIDRQYTQTPFYGSRKMTAWLNRLGYAINRKRVQRLMRKMGLEAIYPKPRTSKNHPEHRIYPYLLRGLSILRPNQVWSTDITYVPMHNGFMYLVAVIDWFSRYVLSWRLSNTLEVDFCIDALDEALTIAKPEIFNSDQGAQFTSPRFTGKLEGEDIAISMDGRGRALDNIFVERLWRSVKYEDLYLNFYETVPHLCRGLTDYFLFYNEERPHQGLDNQVPADLYLAKEMPIDNKNAIHLKFVSNWS